MEGQLQLSLGKIVTTRVTPEVPLTLNTCSFGSGQRSVGYVPLAYYHAQCSCEILMLDCQLYRQHKDRAAQNEQTVETLGSHLEETVRFGEVPS